MPPGKLSVVVRFSVFSIVTSSIRRTTKVNFLIVELKVSVKGSIAAKSEPPEKGGGGGGGGGGGSTITRVCLFKEVFAKSYYNGRKCAAGSGTRPSRRH